MSTAVTKPTKQRVRQYMEDRTNAEQDDPPPSPDEVRRQLGWGMTAQDNKYNMVDE